jgi:hypothetical protein
LAIEKLVFDDLYFVGHDVDNIITNGFSNEKASQTNNFISIISSLISSVHMKHHQ